MFECKVCPEKTLRISDLKAELETLKRLLFPPSRTQEIDFIDQEADALMNGESIPMPEDTLSREASATLGGEYSDGEF